MIQNYFYNILTSCNLQVQVPDVTAVEVVGVVRGSEKPSIFVPANEPSSSQWFFVDVPAIARTCGLPEDTIYVEDINEDVNPSCPYPVPKDVDTLIRSSVMPQDHLNYTLTWYAYSIFQHMFMHAHLGYVCYMGHECLSLCIGNLHNHLLLDLCFCFILIALLVEGERFLLYQLTTSSFWVDGNLTIY